MSSEDKELSISQFFKDYTVIEYLALLFPDLPRRGLRPLFADGKVRSGKLPVSWISTVQGFPFTAPPPPPAKTTEEKRPEDAP